MLVAVACASPLVAQAEPAAELSRLVDAPTPPTRLAIARELARRGDVSLEAWLVAARAFGTFERVASGERRERVELQVGDAVEVTDLWLYVPQGYEPGHLAWDLALRHPDLFAAIAPMIGGPRINPAQGQNNLRYLENVRDLPIRDLQGLKDDPRLVANVQLAFAKLTALGARDAVLHAFEDRGHSFDFAAVDWRKFLGTSLRSAKRAFWVEVTGAEKGVQEDVALRVDEAEWKRLQADDAAMRAFLDAEAAKRTARLQVTRAGGNCFDAEGRRVRAFRLRLSLDMFDPKRPVEVRFAGRTHRRRVEPSVLVLLTEFGERFDRTFLPVAEVAIPN